MQKDTERQIEWEIHKWKDIGKQSGSVERVQDLMGCQEQCDQMLYQKQPNVHQMLPKKLKIDDFK